MKSSCLNLSRKPWPKSGKKKFISKSAKKGLKYVLAGAITGTGAELASKLTNHAAQPAVSDEGEYIVINDYSPSLFKVDDIESTHNSGLNLIPGIRSSVTICIIVMVILIQSASPNVALFRSVTHTYSYFHHQL